MVAQKGIPSTALIAFPIVFIVAGIIVLLYSIIAQAQYDGFSINILRFFGSIFFLFGLILLAWNYVLYKRIRNPNSQTTDKK